MEIEQKLESMDPLFLGDKRPDFLWLELSTLGRIYICSTTLYQLWTLRSENRFFLDVSAP